MLRLASCTFSWSRCSKTDKYLRVDSPLVVPGESFLCLSLQIFPVSLSDLPPLQFVQMVAVTSWSELFSRRTSPMEAKNTLNSSSRFPGSLQLSMIRPNTFHNFLVRTAPCTSERLLAVY